MAGIKSIEKLRELAADINSTEIIDHLDEIGKFVIHSEWLDSWHKAFNRELGNLEREISERYMPLPVDADGVPIQVGDELYNGEVIAFGGLAEGGVVFVHRGFMNGNYILEAFASNVTRHVKPRTIEDVLRELLRDTAHYFPSDCEDDIARAADEIRRVL